MICICLFIGAMGKSAQFPLHVWLPDSMEGPTPISALIHAATMVTAGIFMVARMSPLFELSDTALSFVMVIGAITALFMGFLGIIQNDIKRVVAYSTLSQLGYMTVALGASAYSVAIFHLMTHAFFKALLFLAAGSVIIGMHHDQDIRNMGGLRKYMPITWITSLIGSLALIGTPFFAGFYSQGQHHRGGARQPPAGRAASPTSRWSPACSSPPSTRSACTSWSSTARSASATSRSRGEHDHDHDDAWPRACARAARVAVGGDRCRWCCWRSRRWCIGYMTIEPMLFGDFFKDSIVVDAGSTRRWQELAEEFHGALAMALHALDHAAVLAGAGRRRAGLVLLHAAGPTFRRRSSARFGFVYRAAREQVLLRLVQRERACAGGARMLGTGLWKGGDVGLIDGVVINGSARAVGGIAARRCACSRPATSTGTRWS